MGSRGKPGNVGNQYAPITPEKIQQMQDLLAEGKGRNEIARIVGVSSSTVTTHLPAGSFDPTETRVATEVRQADAAARRAAALLTELRILELNQTHVIGVMEGTTQHRRLVKELGGAEFKDSLDFLPSDDAQRLANARSSSMTIINKLTDTTAGEQAARGLLGAIADSLGIDDGQAPE